VFNLHHKLAWALQEGADHRFRTYYSVHTATLTTNLIRHQRIAGDKWWQLGLADTNCDEYIDALELITALSTLPRDVIHRYVGSHEPLKVWTSLSKEFMAAVDTQDEVMDRLLLVTARLGDLDCDSAKHSVTCQRVQSTQLYTKEYVAKRSALIRNAESSWKHDAVPVPISVRAVPEHVKAWLPIPMSALVFSPPVSRLFTMMQMLTPHPIPAETKGNNGLATDTPPKFISKDITQTGEFIGYSHDQQDNVEKFNIIFNNDPDVMCVNDNIERSSGWNPASYDYFDSFFRRKLGRVTKYAPVELYPPRPLSDIPSFEKMTEWARTCTDDDVCPFDRSTVMPDAEELSRDPPEPVDPVGNSEVYLDVADAWLVKMRMRALGGLC
jgi:hypothetical protein